MSKGIKMMRRPADYKGNGWKRKDYQGGILVDRRVQLKDKGSHGEKGMGKGLGQGKGAFEDPGGGSSKTA